VTAPSPTLLPPGKRSNSELVYDARAGAGLLNERDRATVKAYQKVKRLFWGPTYFQQGPILRARPTPPVQHTLGVGYGSVRVAIFNCQTSVTAPSSSPSNRETVRAARTPPNRHHPPGIKNSKSESYAEIDTDGLRTRPANVVRKFAAKALGLTVPPTLLAEAGEVIE